MLEKNFLLPKRGEDGVARQKRRQVSSHPLGKYLFSGETLCNFAISGNGPSQAVVTDLLRRTMGEIPVIILHTNDNLLMGQTASIWQEKFGANDELGNAAFWVCGNGSFEPFLGMDEMDLVDTIEQLARTAGYTCTAHFQNVIRGHLHLLDKLGGSHCLSGLYYLCSFNNINEFQGNINALNCSNGEKQSILWELGLLDDNHREQFNLFRNVIMRIAHEAKNSGWTPNNAIGRMNISTAIEKNATMLLSVDSNRAEYLLQYLCQELTIHNQKQFLLLIDNVQLENTGICTLLKTSKLGFRFGLLTENLVEMIGGEKNELERVAEKIHRLILFKHGMDTTAQALSELIGKEEIEKVSTGRNEDRRWLGWRPERQGKTVTTTKEKEFRVQSKEIIELTPGRAIVFDALTNGIIRY